MAASAVTGRGSGLADVLAHHDDEAVGASAYALAEQLYPICRSITGDGVRESLRLLQEAVPLTTVEVPSGTRVFDWTVPDEWNIRDAYIKDGRGERVVDFRRHTLHVVSYSAPVHATMTLAELRPHLHTLPDTPDLIPYRTSYYRRNWGFCLSQRQLDAMADAEYDVCIDATLSPGSLTYGEYRIQGATDDEVLLSTHACHPSLCNDNLSGMAVACELARALGGLPLRYSYRFLWMPGTIGAITWLARHEELLRRIRHGLVLSSLGDSGPFTYKRSRRGHAEIDRAVEQVLRSGAGSRVRDFVPYGYDERQYCSPGIDLPVGCLTRTPYGEYPQYHTSADDLSLLTPSALGGSVRRLLEVVQVLEDNETFVNLEPKGEPQLGRRGLYGALGGGMEPRWREMALLWVLSYSDGAHDLLDIAGRSGLAFGDISAAARALQDAGLLEHAAPRGGPGHSGPR